MSWLLPLLLSTSLLLIPALTRPRTTPQPEVSGLLRLLWWINRFYCGLWHRLELEGTAPLPEHGPAILIANHTCGIDNFLLQAGCERVLGFMIVQDWYDHPLCRPFCRILDCIPVKRDGRDLAATRAALRALERGRVVPIFPEGRIHPTSGREFGEGKPGAAYIALRSGVPVVPAYISGTPETRSIWKALLTPSHARVVFGPPIDLSGYPVGEHDRKEAAQEVTDLFMAAIRSLSRRPAPAGNARVEADQACDGTRDARVLAGIRR
jgi:1-acyl-sn-glycerol-3-phosphate acyltransferase